MMMSKGLVAAMPAQAMTRLPAEALTALLAGAFDRALWQSRPARQPRAIGRC
ncbi:hypothetical protein [Mesorhizobium atlanticum]|uniref:hypothetical protein n=1 Tax=Mesorhizobium atlanticum TaxID=2233532 RepID=UPI001FE1C29D|nr:hypothetical protein [Mesorhizobium atlanticum]